MTKVNVPGYEGRFVRARKDQSIRVTDLEGTQIGDMFCHAADESTHYLSTSITRLVARRLFPRVGEYFYSNRHQPILEFVEDNSPGLHDLLMAPCDSDMYAERGFDNHANCKDNYIATAKSAGLDGDVVPDPVNIFQVTPVHPDGRITVERTQTKAGDNVVFRAVLDVIFIITACSSDTGDINGGESTSLSIEVFN
jgi:uncharacterized protein YcgI (DUF1989 family)